MKAKSRRGFAFFYDHMARSMERGPVGRHRRELISPVTGTVLEIGCGTGENFKHYSPLVSRVVAVEPDRHMLRRSRSRATSRSPHVDLVRANAENLPVRTACLDSVIATLVLCSVRDLDSVLSEIWRVLRPEGRLYFFEHVRDKKSPRNARWQDRLMRPWRAIGAGCHTNRETGAAIAHAGFEIIDLVEFDMPGTPSIVRPHIIGEAVKK